MPEAVRNGWNRWQELEADPDARIMKTGDGGFRSAHNVQFATETAEAVALCASVNFGTTGCYG